MKAHIRNKVIISIVSIVLALVCTTAYRFWKFNEMVKSLPVEEPQVTAIADGEYEGEYDLSLVYAKVKVTVHQGRIDKIDILKHDNGNGKAAENIFDKVIKEQKLGVNTVSGATASSKALLKAVENALKKAENRGK